jgi:hypothetical protein
MDRNTNIHVISTGTMFSHFLNVKAFPVKAFNVQKQQQQQQQHMKKKERNRKKKKENRMRQQKERT